MAYLKNSEKRNTLAYRFTVDSKDDMGLIKLKDIIKEHNKLARKWGRVPTQTLRLMARGTRVKWAKADGKNARRYDTYLPHKYATYFDVYVY